MSHWHTFWSRTPVPVLPSVPGASSSSVQVKTEVKVEAHSFVQAGVHVVPKRTSENKFKCGSCGVEFGSYGSCKGHINREHMGVYYGPCEKCGTYTTTNPDTWAKHVAKCAGVAKAAGKFTVSKNE